MSRLSSRRVNDGSKVVELLPCPFIRVAEAAVPTVLHMHHRMLTVRPSLAEQGKSLVLQAKARDGGSDLFVVCQHWFLTDAGAVALTDAVLEAGVLDLVQAAEFLAAGTSGKPLTWCVLLPPIRKYQGSSFADAYRLQPEIANFRCSLTMPKPGRKKVVVGGSD